MPRPRKPGVPKGRRRPENDPRQGTFLFGKPEPPLPNKEQTPNRQSETHAGSPKKIQQPTVKISRAVTTVGRSKVVDWHIGTIGVPRNGDERASLESRMRRIIVSAKRANIHRILFTQDENKGPVADLLQKLGFTVQKDNRGGHTQEDNFYIFTLNIH